MPLNNSIEIDKWRLLKFLKIMCVLGDYALCRSVLIIAFSVQYSYDELNRLIQIRYGDGTVINYSYDQTTTLYWGLDNLHSR